MQSMKLAAVVALTLAGAVAMPSSWAEDQTNVAVVNGVPIPQSRVDFVVKSQIQRSQGQQKDTPEFRQQVKDVLITREVIAQEAVKEGLDKNPAVQTQLDMAKQDFVIQAYFEDFIKNNQPTDEQTRAEYEKIKAQQTGNGEKMEYKVRHILIKVDPNAPAAPASYPMLTDPFSAGVKPFVPPASVASVVNANATGGTMTSPSVAPSMSMPSTAPSSAAGGGGAAGCAPDGTTLKISAKNVAFDSNCLAAPANTPFHIVFSNQDPGIPHNVSIYAESSASKALFKGDLVTGIKTVTYKVKALAPGTYFFRCDVHPTQMTGTFVVK